MPQTSPLPWVVLTFFVFFLMLLLYSIQPKLESRLAFADLVPKTLKTLKW